MSSGNSAADFVRRVIRNVGDQVDRLEPLQEEITSAVGGTTVEPPPEASYVAQVTCGTIGGALVGYFFGKVSKAAALATGGGILLLQTGVHYGYLSVGSSADLARLQNRQDSVQVRANLRDVQHRIEPYLRNNTAFLSSLLAGLCLGYGLS